MTFLNTKLILSSCYPTIWALNQCTDSTIFPFPRILKFDSKKAWLGRVGKNVLNVCLVFLERMSPLQERKKKNLPNYFFLLVICLDLMLTVSYVQTIDYRPKSVFFKLAFCSLFSLWCLFFVHLWHETFSIAWQRCFSVLTRAVKGGTEIIILMSVSLYFGCSTA